MEKNREYGERTAMIKIRDLDMLRNLDIVYESKIIIYGAGDYGKRAVKLLNQLNIPVYGIYDSDERKTDTVIGGYKVLPLQMLAEIPKEDCILVIAIANSNDIKQVLKRIDDLGIREISCYTYFALKYTVEFHLNDKRINSSYRKDLEFSRKMYNVYRYNSQVNGIRQLMWSIKLYDVCLVLTPRKVGTTSVAVSLSNSSIHCIQTDHLLPGNWANVEMPDKDVVKRFLKKEKIKVISMVRDPVSRAISDYFHGLYMEGYSRDYLTLDEDIYCGVKRFMNNETKIGSYGYAFEWYRQDILKLFDIDIYRQSFDKEKGYQIIRKDNTELLLMKTEKLNDFQEIIGSFVGEEDFKLVKANIGDEKIYKFAYDEFKRKVRIPKKIVDFYYKNNAAMDHFYTLEEKESFYKKWVKEG